MPLQFGVLLDWAFSQLWISFSLSVSVFFFLTVSCNIPRLNYTRTHVRTWHAFHLFPALNRLTLQWVLCLFGVVVFKLHGVTIFAFSWRNIARNRITNCTRRRAWLFVSSLRKIRTPLPEKKNSCLEAALSSSCARARYLLRYFSSERNRRHEVKKQAREKKKKWFVLDEVKHREKKKIFLLNLASSGISSLSRFD